MRDLPADGVRLKAREQRLVTFEVYAGDPFTKADALAAAERDIVVTVTADGAIIGGMVSTIDPEIEMPFNDRALEDRQQGYRAKAEQLLDSLDLPNDKVKRVRVRKVSIDVEMEDDGDGRDERSARPSSRRRSRPHARKRSASSGTRHTNESVWPCDRVRVICANVAPLHNQWC